MLKTCKGKESTKLRTERKMMAGEKRVSFGWGKCEELTLGPKAFDCGQSNDRGSEVRWARRVFWSPGGRVWEGAGTW